MSLVVREGLVKRKKFFIFGFRQKGHFGSEPRRAVSRGRVPRKGGTRGVKPRPAPPARRPGAARSSRAGPVAPACVGRGGRGATWGRPSSGGDYKLEGLATREPDVGSMGGRGEGPA